MKIGIGFECDRATWHWVGFDTGRGLCRHADVEFFRQHEYNLSGMSFALLIKKIGDQDFIDRAKITRCKVVYIPVDNYERPDQIEADAWFLSQCSAILIHCERLRPFFEKYCPTIFVEHHNRFGLSSPIPYRENGFAIYVGERNHLKWSAYFLNQNPPPIEIKFVIGGLGDVGHEDSVVVPVKNSMVEWSPRSQREAMMACKCAFDFKGGSWQQMTKPPTKAQKFISSGIPMLVNSESYAFEYFASHGFILATQGQYEKWMSKSYFDQTQEVGRRLSERNNLKNVSEFYFKTLCSL